MSYRSSQVYFNKSNNIWLLPSVEKGAIGIHSKVKWLVVKGIDWLQLPAVMETWHPGGLAHKQETQQILDCLQNVHNFTVYVLLSIKHINQSIAQT